MCHISGPMGPLSNYIELLNKQDIIIACATPSSSPMGISIIRISGFFNHDHFNKVIFKCGPMGPLVPRVATLCQIKDFSSDTVLDTALVTYFSTPNSFTGESVIEISVHGNPRLVDKIIDVFIVNFDLRLAIAGEFTLRAYRNKKLNLSQIEGLDLLLHATTQPLIELSQYMLSGELQNEFVGLKNALDKHQAAIDILTDFSEDVGENEGFEILHSSWKVAKDLINKFYARATIPLDHLLKPSIVLYGPPNAGKSTLFNLLLGYKRSIVSDVAGTTRDYIKESIFYKHNEFQIIDTAGIRETSNQIESEGIYFTHKNLQDAYARVLVYSACNFSNEAFESFCKLGSPTHVLFTHLDISEKPINFDSLGVKVFNVDLLNGGFDASQLIESFLTDLNGYFASKPLVCDRQRIEITKVFNISENYDALIKSDYSTDLALLSSEFLGFRVSAYNLIGVVNVDEILDYVFANFCIGK
jgi:tRNA modification GTPase